MREISNFSYFVGVLSLKWGCLHFAKFFNIPKINFPNDPHFRFAGDTSRIEDKFILHCIMQCTQLHCGTVMNITCQFCIVLYYTILYNSLRYLKFCNVPLYCIIMYSSSLMQSMVLSVLLQNGVAVYMCIGNDLWSLTTILRQCMT